VVSGISGARWGVLVRRTNFSLDGSLIDSDPAIEALVSGRFGCADKPIPRRGADERALGIVPHLMQFAVGVGSCLLGEQAIEGVL
jgi:hypothetical protein